jgi:uncharacterized protein YjbI with pentapeptide repeats
MLTLQVGTLSRANLTDAKLLRADFTDAEFIDANLLRADLTDATLSSVTLLRADMSKAKLHYSILLGCSEYNGLECTMLTLQNKFKERGFEKERIEQLLKYSSLGS